MSCLFFKQYFPITALLILLSTQVCPLAFANPFGNSSKSYYQDSEKGWFWYNYFKPEQKDPEEEQPVAATPNNSPSATELMAKFQEHLDEVTNRAILNPTEANIRAYIQLTNIASTSSVNFADNVQKVLWQNPELDPGVKAPVHDQSAAPYYEQQREKMMIEHLAKLDEKYGVLYVFSSSCQYCKQMGPMVNRLQSVFGIDVVGLTLDGGPTVGFPKPLVNPKLARKLNPYVVPAVYLVDMSTEDFMPISFGLTNHHEILKRIYRITTNKSPAPFAKEQARFDARSPLEKLFQVQIPDTPPEPSPGISQQLVEEQLTPNTATVAQTLAATQTQAKPSIVPLEAVRARGGQYE